MTARPDWFFEHEAEYFEGRLHRLVIEIHRVATEQLEVVYAKEVGDVVQAGLLEEDDLYSFQTYLKGEQVSQQRALSTMALTMLAVLIESFVDEARSRLDKNIFPSAARYSGPGVLLKRVTEFKQRFDLDLMGLPGFDAVQEVVLARNSCVHNGGHPSADYLAQTKHRLLEEVNDMFAFCKARFKDEDRVISCGTETLKEIVKEVALFAESLHKSLNAVRVKRLPKPPVVDTPST